MGNKKSGMKEKIEARIEAEKEAKANDNNSVNNDLPLSEIIISDEDLLTYLHDNRVGDAKPYNRLNRGKITFVPEWNNYLFFNGHHWEIDYLSSHTCQLIEKICRLYEDFSYRKRQEAEEETDKVIKASIQKLADKAYRRAEDMRDKPGQDKLKDMLNRVEDPLFVLSEMFDKKPYLKACKNGVINLKTGEPIKGDPEQYLLKAIPTVYDPELLKVDDPCPEVTSYLLSSLGDKEIVDFIRRLLGYGLITKRKDHIFVIFWGEHGRNGKDTLIKLVTKVMGNELSGYVNVEMFLQTGQTRNNSSSSPDIMDLMGMCIAWINEAEENQKFAHGKLKKLTGGGNINARGNYDKVYRRRRAPAEPKTSSHAWEPKEIPTTSSSWADAAMKLV